MGESARTTEELVHSLMLGELDAEGRRALLERLRDDPAAREAYGSMIEMEAMLHHEFPRAEEGKATEDFRRKKRHAGWMPVLAGMAAAVSLAFVFWKVTAVPAPVIEEVYGDCVLLDVSGVRKPLRAGGKVEATGALMTEGAGSFAKLRFSDGSRVMLSGEGELRIPGEKRKRLLLRTGNLEVEMKPQPAGRPALVETATAKVEVVGTRFAVRANSLSTMVAVSEGKVKLRRLADDGVVEIARDRMATVSLDPGSAMEARPISAGSPGWRAPGAATAGPFRAGTDREGKDIIHYGVKFDSGRAKDFSGLADLTDDSVVRVKFRVANPLALIRVFTVSHDAKGRYAGNRQVEFRASVLKPDADGWRIYEGRLRDFTELTPEGGFDIAGKRLIHLSISVLKSTDQLQVAEAEIGE